MACSCRKAVVEGSRMMVFRVQLLLRGRTPLRRESREAYLRSPVVSPRHLLPVLSECRPTLHLLAAWCALTTCR